MINQFTYRKLWFVSKKRLGGLPLMHSFAIGIIAHIASDSTRTDEEKNTDILGTLADMGEVWEDTEVSDGMLDAGEVYTVLERQKRSAQLSVRGIDVSKVEPLVDRIWAEDVIRNGGIESEGNKTIQNGDKEF